MPNPNQKSLHAQIDELTRELTVAHVRHVAATEAQHAAEQRRDVTYRDLAELKRQFAAEREENARLRGYIQHAQEMDDAASDRVAIQTAPEQLVPRTRLARQNGHSGDDGLLYVKAGDRPRHWTELG